MGKRNVKIVVSLVSLLTVGVLVGSGAGIYFGLISKPKDDYKDNPNSDLDKEPEPGEDKEESLITDQYEPIIYDELVPWLPNLSIRQYPYPIKENKYQYYFTNKEMASLINRFLNAVNYGPEIFNLKEISINRQDLIVNANGRFWPTQSQIGILATEDENNKWLNSEQKIEQAFEILYHEYGHLIYYSYMANILPNINNLDYLKINNHQISKSFLDYFLEEFNYRAKENDEDLINMQAKPISEEITLSDLFAFANYDIDFDTKSKDYYFGLPSKLMNAKLLGNNGYLSFSPSYIDYSYGIEELWTRKYMLATMPFDVVAKDMLNPNLNSFHQSAGLALIGDYQTYTSTYFVEQAIKNLTSKEWREALSNIGTENASNIFEINKFYEDDPFSKSSSDLTKIIAQQFSEKVSSWMGVANSSQISNIFPLNLVGYDQYSKVEGPSWNPWIGNWIKIAGYLDAKTVNKMGNEQIYLAAKNKDSFTKLSSISLVKNAIEYKNSIFAEDRIKVDNNSDTFWIMDSYVDASTFVDQELYFVWQDNILPLTSYRGQENLLSGLASSWNAYYPGYADENIQFDVYQPVMSENKVLKLTSLGKWTNFKY